MRPVGFSPAPARFSGAPKLPGFLSGENKTPAEKPGSGVTAGVMLATGLAAWAVLFGYTQRLKESMEAKPQPAVTRQAAPETPKKAEVGPPIAPQPWQVPPVINDAFPF